MSKVKIVSGSLLSLVSFLSLCACAPLVDQNIMNHVNDNLKPVITIKSPGDGSACANIVTVHGTAKDLATINGDAGKINSLTYEVSSAIRGNIDLQADGIFSFSFITTVLPERFSLKIVARDWNKNITDISLNLHKAPNGIPLFSVTPGNKKVILEWEDIPHTASYTVYYTIGEAQPSENCGVVRTNVQSPCTIDYLTNGNLYTFQLRANPDPNWPGSVSDCLTAIPLSDQTLVPRVMSGYQELCISWNPIPGTDTFEVWRSMYPDIGFVKVKTKKGTSIIEKYPELTTLQWYYYKIRPVYRDNTNSIISAANGAELSPFPDKFNIVTTRYLDEPYPADNIDSVTLAGQHAYMICNGNFFRVMDLTRPIYPSIYPVENSLEIPGATSVAVSGDSAYVACGELGLAIVNLYDRSHPKIKQTINDLTIAPRSIAISGSHIYLTDGQGIEALEIDTLESVLNWQKPDGSIDKLVVAEPYLYISDRINQALYIYNVNDLTTYFKKIDMPADKLDNTMTISGSYAYLAGSTPNLCIIDLDAAEIINTIPLDGLCNGILVSAGYAYVLNSRYGLHILDVSHPLQARIIETIPMAGSTTHIITSGDYVYVFGRDLNQQHYINVIDSRNPGVHAAIISSLGEADGLEGEARECAIYNWDVFVYTEGSGTLNVINVSDRFNPYVINKIGGIPNFGYGMVISGSRAYLACGMDGLKIVDVSNARTAGAEAIISTVAIPGFAYDVAVSGDYAYVTSPNSGVNIIDISEPAEAELIKTIPTPDFAFGISISGSYAYVGNNSAGIQIIDTSDPDNASIANMFNFDGYNECLTSLAPYVFAKEFKNTFRIIDISNPLNKNPAFQAFNIDGNIAKGMALSGPYVYFCVNNNDRCQINFINSKRPFTSPVSKALELPVSAYDVAVSGFCMYVAAGSAGLQVIKLLY